MNEERVLLLVGAVRAPDKTACDQVSNYVTDHKSFGGREDVGNWLAHGRLPMDVGGRNAGWI